jgi:hypothetical protein
MNMLLVHLDRMVYDKELRDMRREPVAVLECPACERKLVSAPSEMALGRLVQYTVGGPVEFERTSTMAKCAGCGATLLASPRGVKVIVPPPQAEPVPAPMVQPRAASPQRSTRGGLAVPQGWTSADIEELEKSLGVDDEPGLSGPQPGGRSA